MKVTFIGTSARHSSIKAGEHLNISRSGTSTINKHIRKCSLCQSQPNSIKQLVITRKCQISYEAENHEALMIKRVIPCCATTIFKRSVIFYLRILIIYDFNLEITSQKNKRNCCPINRTLGVCVN